MALKRLAGYRISLRSLCLESEVKKYSCVSISLEAVVVR